MFSLPNPLSYSSMEVINSPGQRLSFQFTFHLAQKRPRSGYPTTPMRRDLQTIRRDPAAQAVREVWTRSKTYGRSQAV